PALMGVGYIVGVWISFLVFLGGVISWWVAIPIYLWINGMPVSDHMAAVGGDVWAAQIRYLGVGAMVVGGLWALISLAKPIGAAVRNGFAALKQTKSEKAAVLRTERDMPMGQVVIAIGVMIVPIFIIYLREIRDVPITMFMS